MQGKGAQTLPGMLRLCACEAKNGLDGSAPADFHMDALEFVRTLKREKCDTVVIALPYSYR